MFGRRYIGRKRIKERNQRSSFASINDLIDDVDPEAITAEGEDKKSERSSNNIKYCISPKVAFVIISFGVVSMIFDAMRDPAIGGEANFFHLDSSDHMNNSASINHVENICKAGTNVPTEHIDCLVITLDDVIKPQSGGNVTKGYKGNLHVDYEPVTTSFSSQGMCPVNVHWHLGAEHYSLGEYDETGTSPILSESDSKFTATTVRQGFRCKHYDPADVKFTKAYKWKHCLGMQIGETYEVHWPHSAAGACGTPYQYQTPFHDGIFCHLPVLGNFSHLQDQIGVQAQVFSVVNDDTYYHPNLMDGMIVDDEYGQDVVRYTGSTTGSNVNNDICSAFSPISWQVDRKCHLISASSFDKLCEDMKAQSDDMSDDLYPHGSRELVNSSYVADNQFGRRARIVSSWWRRWH